MVGGKLRFDNPLFVSEMLKLVSIYYYPGRLTEGI